MVVLLLLLISLSFGETYLLKVKDGNVPSGFKILKKITEDTYLVKKEGDISTFSYGNYILEKNYKLYPFVVPNDPCVSNRWQYEKIKAFDAWDLSTGSENVYVAVLDTGVDYKNPDLAGNLWRNERDCDYDGQDDDGNGYVDDCYGVNVLCYPEGTYNPNAQGCNAPDALDVDGHGTAVAGIIGAVGNNGLLLAGVNWKVKIIPCKFIHGELGDLAGELECLKYIKKFKAEKGLNIVAINASYGGYYSGSEIQRSEILSLKDLGILYISAAGNEGINNDIFDLYPCNYDLPNQICVGSTGLNDVISPFSNYGFYKVKVSAPGEDVISLWVNQNENTSCDSLEPLYGTSFSTPFITGAVALLKAYKPELSFEEIRRRILTSGDNILKHSGYTYTCNRLNLYKLLVGDNSPKICLSSLELNLGTFESSKGSEKNLIIRNTGEVQVKITNVYTDSNVINLDANNCIRKVLNTFEECSVKVSVPAGFEGSVSGKVFVEFENSELNTAVSVKGTGIPSLDIGGGGGGCNSFNVHFFLSLLTFIILLKGILLKGGKDV